jgi:hypothetical protein
MGSAACARAGIGLLVLALAACSPNTDTGYVELRVFPAFNAALVLNSEKLEPLKDGRAILRQRVGPARLQLDRGGQLALLCEFEVRKNRIVTVTVSTFDRRLRCEVQK